MEKIQRPLLYPTRYHIRWSRDAAGLVKYALVRELETMSNPSNATYWDPANTSRARHHRDLSHAYSVACALYDIVADAASSCANTDIAYFNDLVEAAWSEAHQERVNPADQGRRHRRLHHHHLPLS